MTRVLPEPGPGQDQVVAVGGGRRRALRRRSGRARTARARRSSAPTSGAGSSACDGASASADRGSRSPASRYYTPASPRRHRTRAIASRSATEGHGCRPWKPTRPLTIIRDPQVYLVGRQTVDDDGARRVPGRSRASRTWSTDTEVAGEKLVEVAGRLCYMSFAKPRPGGNAAYIGHILEVGHGSVLEHAVFNLIITGRQPVVHPRTGPTPGGLWLFAAQSTVRGRVGLRVRRARRDRRRPRAAPDLARGDRRPASGPIATLADGLAAKFADIDDRTLRRKKAREAARSVLPNATETKIFVTANARALRHFIEMRADPAADVEIRKVAVAVLKLLQAESPNLFGDYTIIDLPEGGQAATTPHRKV